MLYITAIFLGILLSIITIGPIFFFIIETSLSETSLSKGFKSAVILNLGVILADIIFIIIANYSKNYLNNYNSIYYKIYGIITIILYCYIFYFFLKKKKIFVKNYFFQGFILNIININTILFWISIFFIISFFYMKKFLFISILLLSFFFTDLIKIYLFIYLINFNFNKQILFNINYYLGLIILIIGFIIFIKNLFLPNLILFKFLKKLLPIHTLKNSL
ncbi:MAG: hypothetical protein NHF98_00460 [Candidatus Bostrichicola ureolyticus]|nr:MAG: hypothetical protein NHF98_00460 [Candidatus Bostrichicola ureolyticus]